MIKQRLTRKPWLQRYHLLISWLAAELFPQSVVFINVLVLREAVSEFGHLAFRLDDNSQHICSISSTVIFILLCMLEITSEMTQKKTHSQETDTLARGHIITAQASSLAVYFYIAPLGRVPDSMIKPFQYSACA